MHNAGRLHGHGLPWQPRLMSTPDNAIPIVHQGQQFTSRKALADHLAPLLGKSSTAIQKALSRYDGDVERVLTSHRDRTSRRSAVPAIAPGRP